jgi:hypothetical protein
MSGFPAPRQPPPPTHYISDRRENPELSGLTTEELKERAKNNEQILRDLEEELRLPQAQQARLAALERRLHHLRPGKDLRIEAPVLKQITEAVVNSHEIDHQQELEALREEQRKEYFMHVDPVKYLHPPAQGLVLGRNAMPLDRNYIAQEQWKKWMEHHQHPAVEQVRYAGHVSKPQEHLDCVFVKEEGFLKRQPVYPTPYRNEFWLNLDGHTRGDLEWHREAVHQAAEDPVAQRVARRGYGGAGEDAQPVDWLGQLKRGIPMPPDAPPSDGFTMPRWMY